ncbi:unnamed protein product [Arabidopsis thaliana]|uniref:Uncharacterized protein n=1 Tax=Arabidopsis thaliana TaxID=3702 RepID=A0A654GCR1_ARATH|nr:unnamed protein product [Arabidopsis thaliana]
MKDSGSRVYNGESYASRIQWRAMRNSHEDSSKSRGRDRELKRDSDLSLPGEDSRATRAAEIVVPTEYLV